MCLFALHVSCGRAPTAKWASDLVKKEKAKSDAEADAAKRGEAADEEREAAASP